MPCLELISGPVEAWWAAVGTSFPTVTTDPSGTHTLLGSSGDLNYDEDGVSIELDQSLELWRSLGSGHPRCAFRTDQELHVKLTLVDMTLTELRLGLNLNAVATDAGPPSVSTINLDYGLDVDDMALLIRGTSNSPEFAGGNLQVEFNRVVEMAAHSLDFVKGSPVGIELDFVALLDDNGAVGQIVVQNA